MAALLVSALLLIAAGPAQSSSAPFSLTIAAVQTEVRAGSEVRLDLTITNNSNRMVMIALTTPMCDYEVEVRDSAGNLAPDTELKSKSDCAHRATGRAILCHLRPHSSQKDTVPVTWFSDMSKPGKYTVQVTWKAPQEFGSVAIKSNIVTITVTE